MKYKALNNGYDFIKEDNLLDTLLKNRGVENPKKLLNLDKTVIHNGMLFKNMREGIDLLIETLHKAKTELQHICIIQDSDVDGMSSACLFIQYLQEFIKDKSLNIKIDYIIHNGKEHGIVLKELEGLKIDLLIVPDAGSNDIKQCEELNLKGTKILILDHHEIELNNPYAIVINCKDHSYPNPTLAGVGVVYKFCKEFDLINGINLSDKYLDLVALGTIADVMDLRNYETRYLVLEGLKHFGEENLFLKEIIKQQSYSLKDKVNITGIGWYIAPLLNAVVRTGKKEEKEDVFKALLGVKEFKDYKPRKSRKNPDPQIEKQTLQEYMARVCTNIKSRQTREVDKGVKQIKDKIKEKQLDKNKILMVDCTKILNKTYTGLVANKLTNEYKRPTILLRQKGSNENLFGGSGRNYRLSSIVNLKEFLKKLDTFEDIQGHANSFGFSINADNLVSTRDKINQQLKDILIEDVYKVDYEIPIGRLKSRHILQVGQWSDVWGNTLDEPLFAITDIYISTDDIQLLGERKNIIKFEKKIGSNAITFIKFFANEDIYNKMILRQQKGLISKKVKKIKIDIVGKFKVNKWNENEYPQIEIVDFNSNENQDFIF